MANYRISKSIVKGVEAPVFIILIGQLIARYSDIEADDAMAAVVVIYGAIKAVINWAKNCEKCDTTKGIAP